MQNLDKQKLEVTMHCLKSVGFAIALAACIWAGVKIVVPYFPFLGRELNIWVVGISLLGILCTPFCHDTIFKDLMADWHMALFKIFAHIQGWMLLAIFYQEGFPVVWTMLLIGWSGFICWYMRPRKFPSFVRI